MEGDYSQDIDALKQELYSESTSPPPDGHESTANPSQSDDLKQAMDRLSDQLTRLTSLFEQANKELYDEYSQGFHDETQKLDRLLAQNEKIARGVLAVADLVKGHDPIAPPETGKYPLNQPEQAPPPVDTATDSPPSRRSLMKEFR